MNGVAGQGECICAVEEGRSEVFKRGSICGKEIERVGGAASSGGIIEENAYGIDFADVDYIMTGSGVAICGRFLDFVDLWLAGKF